MKKKYKYAAYSLLHCSLCALLLLFRVVVGWFCIGLVGLFCECIEAISMMKGGCAAVWLASIYVSISVCACANVVVRLLCSCSCSLNLNIKESKTELKSFILIIISCRSTATAAAVVFAHEIAKIKNHQQKEKRELSDRKWRYFSL